jgi:hypothetical protein
MILEFGIAVPDYLTLEKQGDFGVFYKKVKLF